MSRYGIRLSLAVVAGLLVSACLPKGMRVPQSPLLSALERKSGLIAYVGTDGNIYTVDQGGGNQRALTADARVEGADLRSYGFPTWSPDGERVAFVSYQGTQDGGVEQAGLHVVNRDGSDSAELFASAENRPLYLYWSPDSQHLSFLATTPGSENLVLDVIPASGGEAQTLDAGQPYYWNWAPDSKSMIVHVGGARDMRPDARLAKLLFGASLDEPVTEVALDHRPALFQSPEFSPDGSRLLFAAQAEDGSSALQLADASGQVQRTITTFAGSVAFAWSPDGKRIAYITSDEPRPVGALGKLTIVDAEGKKDPIVAENEPAFGFFWAPDSQQVAYFIPSIVQATPEAGGSGGSGGDITVRLSLFVVDVGGGGSRPVAGFVPTREFLNVLPYFDQYHRSATLWSPDSRNLVLSAYRSDGTAGIWVAAASGNLEARFLTEGVLGFWSSK